MFFKNGCCKSSHFRTKSIPRQPGNVAGKEEELENIVADYIESQAQNVHDQTNASLGTPFRCDFPPTTLTTSKFTNDVEVNCSKACCYGPTDCRLRERILEVLDDELHDIKHDCDSHGLCHEHAKASRSDANGAFIIQIEPELNLTSESITLNVQGMTCTSCEKSLFDTLASYREISDIKTSLLLAQARFTLAKSTRVNRENVASIVGRRTGFVCARSAHVGGQLELVAAESLSSLMGGRPHGISDIAVVGKDRIRVSYHPKEIGARDLISNPYFRGATLAPLSPPRLVAAGRAHVYHEFLMTLLSAALTLPVLVLSYASFPDREITHGGICLAFATLVQVLIAGPFYPRAFNSLIVSRAVEMDMLVVLSTTTAYIYSLVAYGFLALGKPLPTPEFFETSTLLVTLIMFGRTVSAYARQTAMESISIESKQEPKAVLVLEDGGLQEIDARLLQYGDVFKVFPEATVVTDGTIIEGQSEIDESLVTGESTLISKEPGMSVVAGSINHSGTLTVELSTLPCDNTIRKIGAMVDEAISSKPKVQEISDKVAGRFVPAILIITCFVFTTWVLIGKIVKHQSTSTASINAMTYAISVLIVSCPCAIGLAVPMVVVIAGGVGARHGLILKSAESLENGRKVTHVVFDKTGTLTDGHLSVVSEEYFQGDEDHKRAIILGLVSASEHPVSIAITSYLKSAHEEKAAHIHGIKSIPGGGIEATYDGSLVRAGNPYWLGVQNDPAIIAILQKGLTIFCITQNDQLTAVFGLRDQIRADAISTVRELRNRGIEVSIISGDNETAVSLIALQLGISPANTRAQCSPKDKQAYIHLLLSQKPSKRSERSLCVRQRNMSQSKSKNIVLFCGDGTNDAIALAQASIGVHINRGTSVAQSAAGVILMRPSLRGITTLMDLSRAFHKRVAFNFAWSFVYNTFAILLAAGAFPRARIEPRYAGLGELCSVVPIVAVALGLRLKRF